ncbi:hypothetical protein J6590_003218 [Homalodisca vitripennis]|nr:hypothetical protein J6590_003218 [Homalodisca vitripennis]
MVQIITAKYQVVKKKKGIEIFFGASYVKWVPRGKRKNYIQLTLMPKVTCTADLGYQGGKQDKYFNVHSHMGAVPHKMMHVVEFVHEQQRIDRGCYV